MLILTAKLQKLDWRKINLPFIRIRGYSSFNEVSTPLFLLDAIPVSRETIRTINPSIVERIEVIKDAAKLAMYGSRGANGVIAIYTKRGLEDSGAIASPSTNIVTMEVSGYVPITKFKSVKEEDLVNPDLQPERVIAFWSPHLETNENGEIDIEFLTSEHAEEWVIKIEGITFNGYPVFKTYFIKNTEL